MIRFFRSSTFWFILVAALLVIAGIVPTIWQWGWLNSSTSGTEANSTTLRNVALILGGVLALAFGVWRGLIAERQAHAAQHQVETAQHSLLNERYQKGAEMLGSSVLTVRLGGIYALQRLAEEYPDRYHNQVMQLLCAFVRHPIGQEIPESGQMQRASCEEETKEQQGDPFPAAREDVKSAMTVISIRDERRIQLEKQAGFTMNLRDADIRGLSLPDTNLSGADLTGAKLCGVNFWGANLASAKLTYADLCCTRDAVADAGLAVMGASLEEHDSQATIMIDADLSHADLSGANLSNALLVYANLTGSQLFTTKMSGSDLSQARFSTNGQNPAEGFTQADLNEARADTSGSPELDGVVDAITGQPLVWMDGSPNDRP